MSGIPIISIFKESHRDELKPADIFSKYRKVQGLRKLKSIEVSKLSKADEKIRKIDQEISQEIENVDVILSDKLTVTAAEFQDFCHENFHRFKDADFSVDDFDRLFFKFVSSVKVTPETDALLTMKAEIDDTDHLIVCQDPENCDKHRSHSGLGTIKIDIRDF